MSPVQLRLGFAPTAQPFRMHLTLAGLMVNVDVVGITEELAGPALSSFGLPIARRPAGLAFPVASLPLAAELDENITVTVSEELEALWELVTFPSDGNTPVEVVMDAPGNVTVRWHDGSTARSAQLHPSATAALLTLDIPFVAGFEAFEYLRETCNLPVLIGRARVNLDGFIEVSTSKPQLAEAAGIPGMFRIDSTTLGVPLSYADYITRAPGFVWDTPPAAKESFTFEPIAVPLSDHSRNELRQFALELAETRARVVAWGPGMGRRFFALAAAVAVGSLPILVVTGPERIWAWQRHAQLLGHTSGNSADVDVTVVTYAMLTAGYDQAAGTVIFDGLLPALASSSQVAAHARRLVAASDSYRICVEEGWECSDMAAMELMSVLRPAEFDPDWPVAARYPADPWTRFHQHVDCYLSRREGQAQALEDFKKSTVLVVDTPAQLTERMERLLASASPAPVKLTGLLELSSFGSAHCLSPKISQAVAAARSAQASGGTVAVVCRHPRTAELVLAMLRGTAAQVADTRWYSSPVTPGPGVTLVLYERDIPPLSAFTHVIVVDYPWSTAVVDDAVGSAALGGGVQDVTLIHLRGSLDDKLAVLAAHRRDGRALPGHSLPPSDNEVAWLLS